MLRNNPFNSPDGMEMIEQDEAEDNANQITTGVERFQETFAFYVDNGRHLDDSGMMFPWRHGSPSPTRRGTSLGPRDGGGGGGGGGNSNTGSDLNGRGRMSDTGHHIDEDTTSDQISPAYNYLHKIDEEIRSIILQALEDAKTTKVYVCLFDDGKCGSKKSFKEKKKYLSHLYRHGIKLFACRLCGLPFTLMYNRNVHEEKLKCQTTSYLSRGQSQSIASSPEIPRRRIGSNAAYEAISHTEYEDLRRKVEEMERERKRLKEIIISQEDQIKTKDDTIKILNDTHHVLHGAFCDANPYLTPQTSTYASSDVSRTRRNPAVMRRRSSRVSETSDTARSVISDLTGGTLDHGLTYVPNYVDAEYLYPEEIHSPL